MPPACSGAPPLAKIKWSFSPRLTCLTRTRFSRHFPEFICEKRSDLFNPSQLLDTKAAGSVCAARPHVNTTFKKCLCRFKVFTVWSKNDSVSESGSWACLTFASCERGDLSGSGSDVVDDGILEPGNPEHNPTHNWRSSYWCLVCTQFIEDTPFTGRPCLFTHDSIVLKYYISEY